MGSLGDTNLIIVLLVFSCSCLQFSAAIDTIALTRPINNSEVVISGGSVYKLGFFSPANSTLRYVGIWFNIPITTLTVIWVANRDKPLNDSSGLVTISDDGNLVVLNGRDEVIWSSGVSPSRSNSTAQLLDTGNLILRDSTIGSTIWESFHEPYDSFVPNMEISTSAKEEIRVRSWKSPSDPSTGSFSIGINHPDAPELFIWNDSRPYWRSGPWNGRKFIGVPKMNNLYLDGYHLVDDNNGTVSLSFTYANQSVHLYYMLNSQGVLLEKYWEQGMDDFLHSWLGQETDCDVYGMCGAFGSCNSSKSPICSCLEGYRPRNVTEWNTGNWSSGCIRSAPFKCERRESGGENGKEDGFLQLTTMKAPDFGQRLADLNNHTDCRSYCLNNCSCSAYIYDTEIGCMAWNGDLIDVQKFSYAGTDLYIHVASAELAVTEKKKGRNITVTVTVSVIIGTIAAVTCALLAWKLMGKRRVAKFMKFTSKTGFGETMDEVKIQELPLFKFEVLQTATNNFHLSNKLGEGGFGPVYKGKLLDGREIAVKRLLKSSGQGFKEFMTEVEVISKLQHRNLVRLLGCCAEGDEKMLIYEYMPNGSLDAILFDQQKREELDWKKRFNIMEGISRGLLYLHRDSRLKIIHRDIKASNILLDEALNPKISDFGTARIFGGNEDKANTLRVVGTYGYMSPEYAMEGHFSEKSDVYSFGVLVLEIISGRKITSFHQDERSSSLLALAWRLWNEGSVIDLADPSIFDPTFEVEILRCIHVGLLCVQELAKDRPAVSVVVSMLNSEIAELPAPKQPAFSHGRIAESTESSSSQQGGSVGSVTITAMDGR